MTSNTLSFVVASKNSEKTIAETLRSIVDVAGGLLSEIIVLDGNSTDGTEAIVRGVLGETRHTFARQRGTGLYAALNEGVELASSTHIMFVHSDDILLSFPKTLGNLDGRSVLVGSVALLDERLRVKYTRFPPLFRNSWLKHFPFIMHPNAIYPAMLLKQIPYDEGRFGRRADMFQICEMASLVNFRSCTDLRYGFRISDASTTVRGIRADGYKESAAFWFFRVYHFVFFEDRRIARLFGRAVGRRAWVTKE